MRIRDHRKRIDATDRRLVRLLNRRLRMAVEVGRLKAARGLPLRDAVREREILRLARRCNGGPLDERGLRSFFQWLLAQTRRQMARALREKPQAPRRPGS